MSQPLSRARLTYAEYLELERASELKHEYLRGEVFAMADGTPEHSRLAANVIRELGIALRGRSCAVFTSDARVRIEETDRATYPGVTVVCGRLEPAGDDPDAITNPVVIVEILSDATEADDRGEKFAHYRRVASLREYVLVSQRARRIEVYRRQEDRWLLDEAETGQILSLESPAQAVILGMMALVLLVTLTMLLVAGGLERVLGGTGMDVIARIFGIILAALAAQLILEGLGGSGVFRP